MGFTAKDAKDAKNNQRIFVEGSLSRMSNSQVVHIYFFSNSFANFASLAVKSARLSSAQTKFRHQRQMVRRQQGHAAAMQQKFFQR